MSNSVVRIDTRELDRIASRLNTNRKAIGRRIAFDIELWAKVMTPKDTTALENSVYTAAWDGDYQNGETTSFSAVDAKVKGKRPDVETEAHPTPTGNIIANVGPCVDYAEPVEYGHTRGVSVMGETFTANVAAQPYLTPAVEKVAQKYNDGSAWKELVE